MMPPEMEQQWRYMEMQRQQWMAAAAARQQQQQQNTPPPSHTKPGGGLKRPLPNKPIPLTNNNGNTPEPPPDQHLSNSTTSEGDTTPHPTKRPKLSPEDTGDKLSLEDGGKTVEDSSHLKDSQLETSPVGNSTS